MSSYLREAAIEYRSGRLVKATKEPSADPLDGFVFDGDEGSLEPPRALVKQLLPFDGIAFIGGQSGAGKTFIAVDLAVSLTSGEPFFGRKVVERVGVAIFAAEGASTLPLRISVARNEKAHGEILPIAWLGAVPDLKKSAEVASVIARLKALDARFRTTHNVRLGAVIFDTLAATFDLSDEDDNSEAAKTIKIMMRMGNETGALIVPVHHYGKGKETGLRGASGWRGGCDAIISVLADRNEITGRATNRSLALAKSRVGEEGPIANFELRFVKVGVDEDGDDYGTCVIDPMSFDAATEKSERLKLPRAAIVYRQAMQIALLEDGARHWPFGADGSEVKAVDREAIREEFYRTWPADGETEKQKASVRRRRFNDGEKALLDRKSIATREQGGTQLVWAVRSADAEYQSPERDAP